MGYNVKQGTRGITESPATTGAGNAQAPSETALPSREASTRLRQKPLILSPTPDSQPPQTSTFSGQEDCSPQVQAALSLLEGETSAQRVNALTRVVVCKLNQLGYSVTEAQNLVRTRIGR